VVNDRFRSVNGQFESTSTVFADALNIRPAGSSMEVIVGLTINTDRSRIVGVSADFSDEFTQTTVNDTIRFAVIAVESDFTVNATGYKIEQGHDELE
jgi:hypothetical protein